MHCGESVAQAFCSQCGQRNGLSRLSFKGLLNEYLDRIVGLDSRFLRTVRDLTIRPGKVFHAFLEGDRVRYLGPVAYYFLLFTVYLLLLNLLGIGLEELAGIESRDEMVVPDGYTAEEVEQKWKIADFINKYIQFFTLLMFPFWALWSLLLFRKAKLRFVENFVFIFYAVAHPTLLGIVGVLCLFFTGYNLQWLSSLAGPLFFIWAGIGYYRPKNKWLGGLKVIALLLLGYASFGFCIWVLQLLKVLG